MKKHRWIAWALCCTLWTSIATAELDLVVLWPKGNFITNNHQVEVRGYLQATEGHDVIVSLSTPAGVRDFAATYPTLDAFTVDFQSQKEIAALYFVPVQDQGLMWGPRKIRLRFSGDGVTFHSPMDVAIPLAQKEPFSQDAVALPSIQTARYLRIQILEGWQAEGVQIHQAEFLTVSKERLRAQVASVSLRLSLNEIHEATFEVPVPLKDGENRIALSAALDIIPFDTREHSDTEVLQLTRIRDLTEEQLPQGSFALSDGWNMELFGSQDAFRETLRGIEILRMDPETISNASYRNHERIVPGSSPVLPYEFLVSHRTTFAATATAFLEGQHPQLAVDGDTEYPSTWVTSLVPLPVSWTVDFGGPELLGEIQIHAHTDSTGSFGPQVATLLISEGGVQFREILQQISFEDSVTPIILPEAFEARFVRLVIEESKQANNIQINEIEFYDDTGTPIIPLVTSDRTVLERPVILRLTYGADDLAQAQVTDPTQLAVFVWHGQQNHANGGFWQFAGGHVDEESQTVSVELNYLTQLALFESVPIGLDAYWSFNPFSPDSNGIADTTRLTLHLTSASQTTPVELSILLFDLSGRRIKSLLDQESIATPWVHVEWDGTDRTGRVVSIGAYIYQIQAGNETYHGTIVVAK